MDQTSGTPLSTATATVAPETAERKADLAKCLGCGKRPRAGLPEGASRCDRCVRRHRRQMRLRNRKMRADARAKGLCGECRKVKSETYACAACTVKRGKVPKKWKEKQDWSAKGSDPWRKDGDGWQRYRGKGRRGAPPAAAGDDSDIASALDALEKGRAALLYARSPEVTALPRIQRKGARDEAVALLALAARFLDDVCDRNGGEVR